ncbi:transposase family protein [Manganibacter manganicus]|uniref:transposase family protein n=1 Tax=Manganibacter manganicus TaxID=1873176 RepID=UPI00195D52F6|nr:transposase family protein [Pseudaminobacter manganicus]
MGTADEAILEGVVFMDHFADLPNPRQLSKVIYPLDEILLLSLLAVVAGAETFTAIAQFGKTKLALLRRFRPFANGTPDHDRWARCSPRSTPSRSRSVSSPGSQC